jgi:hypothetical protein
MVLAKTFACFGASGTAAAVATRMSQHGSAQGMFLRFYPPKVPRCYALRAYAVHHSADERNWMEQIGSLAGQIVQYRVTNSLSSPIGLSSLALPTIGTEMAIPHPIEICPGSWPC